MALGRRPAKPLQGQTLREFESPLLRTILHFFGRRPAGRGSPLEPVWGFTFAFWGSSPQPSAPRHDRRLRRPWTRLNAVLISRNAANKSPPAPVIGTSLRSTVGS